MSGPISFRVGGHRGLPKIVDQFSSLAALPETPLFLKIDERDHMDELMAAYGDITASGSGPPNRNAQCDAAKAAQRSLAEPCANNRCARTI
ncbi:hypothetical protein IVA79_26945 [Bradyrhizobium sp. 138]|uniref:hypothetical protein n=1 Tax=Bradyrhizobium sp. 138 TaxID=2782615 RepID=UPI001FF9E97F|nr:hypothetical protein [Bradyrhizobium sp. 138]MCK1737520.1 hypothetical protein [Bradyrhizobium sp. 138]